MSISIPPSAPSGTSTRPYLVRALHEWCTDNGFTPYLAVFVGPGVKVPVEYVQNNEIVLNISFNATSSMRLGNDAIEFRARFAGVARDIYVPIDHVIAIYARENGQGMAFPAPVINESASTPHKAGASEITSERGLRLASKVKLPEASEPSDSSSLNNEPPSWPEGPGTGGGSTGGAGRPSLKRVK
ncbi:MAG: ClpXP protease specificity-enhancing factor [Burkholderiales bacterium]